MRAARTLARQQNVSFEKGPTPTPLLSLLERAAVSTDETYGALATDVRAQIPVSVAAEWLLDNHYLIEEQIRAVREDLPAHYGTELPHLVSGPLAGYPRIFEAIVLLVCSTDARLDRSVLEQYFMAYQEEAPLRIGEVWAIPITLRVALVENVRRLGVRILEAHRASAEADTWANRVLEAATPSRDHPETPTDSAVRAVLRDLQTSHPEPAAPFIIRLSQRLRGQGSQLEPVVAWLDACIERRGTTLDELMWTEHQTQAADQVSIANTITSIRFLSALEWREFFEDISIVEHVLREDPAGVYARMDFMSRDRYRHAVEKIAERCPLSEIEVAEAAVSCALEALDADPSDSVRSHVGYHLISGGRYRFERSIHYRPRLRELVYRGPLAQRGLVYWGLLCTLTALLTLGVTAYAMSRGMATAWTVALAALTVIPASEVALAIVNRIAAALWPPRTLPRLDFLEPVAAAHRTMVVVPALLSSPKAAQHVIDNLELAFIANRDPNICFGLIGDLRAAPTEHLAEDEAIIEAARNGIRALNELYGQGDRGPFHLFIRSRRYAPADDVWMGWERKRGALEEFNRLLRGASDTSFHVREGDPSVLPSITFVITLDADTVLPRDAARKLISTIAHPLNRALVDRAKRRVVRGYGLVQPRVGMSLESAERSFFAWLHSGPTGLDPYAAAISDTYQDVFGEGSFTGKGIYEVDVYNAVLQGRLPENSLLSHDLLEGSYLRTALASDIEVLDEQPSSYASHTARLHRWVRGDWQTLPWLGASVPSASGRERNPLSAVARWKILDNLRRSLLPITLIAWIVAGWLAHPGLDRAWLGASLGVAFFPFLVSLTDTLRVGPRVRETRRDIRTQLQDLWRDLARCGLALACLPHQAVVMTDAITRALWRMLVSRRNILEWETAADVERRLGSSLPGFVRRMWVGETLTVALVVATGIVDPVSLLSGAPLVLAWAMAPLVAWRSSQPRPPRVISLTEEDLATIRRTARRTWRFFETFVTPEDHYLAPDNFQEDPSPVVAHRTSPTNIGLQLLSTLAAYDLGYIALPRLTDAVSKTLATLVGMERFRGHFYNWYDTQTLQPLRPNYVSTVDSGNLVGHLIALRSGLFEASERPLINEAALAGLADTVQVALEDLIAAGKHIGPPTDVRELRIACEELLRRVTLDETPTDLSEWHTVLAALKPPVATIERLADRLAGDEAVAAPVRDAVRSIASDLRGHLATIETYAPWAGLLAEAPEAIARDERLAPLFAHTPSLVGLAEGLDEALRALDEMAEGSGPAAAWAATVVNGIREARPRCITLLAELRLAADVIRRIVEATDFGMLFDENRKLFSIGFNTAEGRLDASFYDLLASECRLASYIAIAKGEVPQEHWFRLGRPITRTEGGFALVSWSASMFEYLMPVLVMRSWPQTLLDQTYAAVVRAQIAYGRRRGVPWGVSESAFAARDVAMTYQYQAFGVPGLGLKRGLSDDIVIAPYATMLALPIDPRAALDNLEALARHGAQGRFGYYEAIDYTPGRIPAGRERAIVRAYMAHHQGMSLIALANMVTDQAMQERFHADPLVTSAELLLQERLPRRVQLAHPHVEEVRYVRPVRELPPPTERSYPTAHTPVPATHFLSNGSYSVMLTNAGGGYSRWRDRTVTRYREDVTRDCWGMFFYLKDLDSDAVWSATYQPTLTEPEDYHVTFAADKALYRRLDHDVETRTEVVVSPEDDVEVRRLTITNHRREPLRLRVVSYFEVTLAPRGADHAHKAFSNLFVETEALEEDGALLFTRRPRSAHGDRLWGMHVLACDQTESCEWSYETDRARFLGRLGTPVLPAALAADEDLTRTVGAVLDPVCAISRTITLEPGMSAHLAFATGVAGSRDEILGLVEKYHDMRGVQRAFDLAWSTSQIELKDLGITPEEAVTYQRLASRLLLTDPYSRLKVHTEEEPRLQISGLWAIGISGDHPILLVEVERLEQTPLVRQALLAHQYWRSRGFECDLVILNTKPSAYASELDGRLRALLRTGHALQMLDRPAGVHLRVADQIAPEILDLLRSVARAVLKGDGGPIALQLDQRAERPTPPPPLLPSAEPVEDPAPAWERPRLLHDNGYGGFDPVTGEYVIVLEPGVTTPAPWVNVVANPQCGALISEAGIGCTWVWNSHENRLTTWNNDPVSDGTGEVFYVRDDATGEFWSPTPLPVRSDAPYIVRHGAGYTRFEHTSHGIAHDLTYFVAAEDPVRLALLRLKNVSGRRRYLSVAHLVEWSLGDSRSRAQQRVVTWWDEGVQALMAHNHFNWDFPGRPAFLASDGPVDSYTADRTEFLGRNGDPRHPAAMGAKRLGGNTGRFLDTCGALMRTVVLEPQESVELTFALGQAPSLEEAHALIRRYQQPGTARMELDAVVHLWDGILGAVTIETPDASLDRIINGPALYQALACRFWGRTALYQSSGAFGFRDQLQDCLALLYTRPDLVREHIIEAARHQFVEGDVLHWWHPSSGRGVRTRFVDDRLWLPFVTAEYVRATGDASVLDVEVPFIEGPPLSEGAEDLYLQPAESTRIASIYEHCVAAIEASLGRGPHGLPLIGGGDWNDGMNRVGIGGTGESVWMGWFLDVVIRSFAPIIGKRGDAERAQRYLDVATSVIEAVEHTAWDGAWYRRAYFDDGTPLGTREADECQIDAIAQAWAAISGSGDPKRAMQALEAVEEKLVRWEDKLVALLTPPFDRMEHDPGYIKGYVPGVRENGGQYTHAAIWVALAYALTGDGDEAVALLDLINPLEHATDPASVELYKVEPYVLAADVYAIPPHVGRGGWTWYTGSASWYYRVAVRDICGLKLEASDGDRYLLIDPCVPKSWTSWRMTYRFGNATYVIEVSNPRGVNRGVERVALDGRELPDARVPLADDGQVHTVHVTMLGG